MAEHKSKFVLFNKDNIKCFSHSLHSLETIFKSSFVVETFIHFHFLQNLPKFSADLKPEIIDRTKKKLWHIVFQLFYSSGKLVCWITIFTENNLSEFGQKLNERKNFQQNFFFCHSFGETPDYFKDFSDHNWSCSKTFYFNFQMFLYIF